MSGTGQISYWKKEAGLLPVLLVITEYLLDFNILNGNTWTDEEIKVYAKAIVKDYWMLKPKELIYAMRIGMRKRVFGKVTYLTLTEWFEDYLNQRGEISTDIQQATKSSQPADSGPQEVRGLQKVSGVIGSIKNKLESSTGLKND